MKRTMFEEIRIEAVNNGFLINRYDRRTYDDNRFLCNTWDEVLAYLKDNEAKVIVYDDSEDNKPTVAELK